MPTDRRPLGPKYDKKPWHARVGIGGNRYSLGYYATYEEAKSVEDEFRELNGATARISRAERYADIVKLREQGYSNAAIAKALNIKPGNLKLIVTVQTKRMKQAQTAKQG